MGQQILHQFSEGTTVGDAITDQAFAIRSWLREAGCQSEIYAAHIHPRLQHEVRPAHAHRLSPGETKVIYHHSIGSSVAEQLLALSIRILLIYHNVTPPQFYSAIDPAMARQLQQGREQLLALHPRTELALGDSPFNEQELQQAGFVHTGVLPIALDERQYAWPSNPELVKQFQGSGPILLFVGRLAPNKRQEDLIKLLYYYRRIEPLAKVVLVGSRWSPGYVQWLQGLARSLGLEEHVVFTDHVPQQDMVTFYRMAALYVSMSEHEGFGKPLIESMFFGLPIMAYASSSVPDTLGSAGVLFHEKNYEVLAELADMLVKDTALRQAIIARQRARMQTFLAPQVQAVWQTYFQCFLNVDGRRIT
jgi:glycosyltransferase involved in cell wall biosynthesis